MKSKVIQVLITKEDDWYTAEDLNAHIVTQGKTLDELKRNIKEVVELYFA